MKKLRRLSLSYLGELRNQEFPDAYASICRKLEGCVITEEYVTECLELAIAKQGELGLLKNMRAKHLLTTTISELSKDRQDYFRLLNATVKNAFRSPFEEDRKAAKLLDLWLDRYREFIYKPKMSHQHNLVNQLNDDIANNPEIAKAMDTLNLIEILSSIEATTEDIKAAEDERSRDREAQSRAASELRRNATEAIKSLMDALRIAITLKSENSATYVGIWNEVCMKLGELNAATQSRRTRMRTAAKKAKENENEKGSEQPNDDDVDVKKEKKKEVQGDIQPTSTAPKSTSVMQSRPYSMLRMEEHMDGDLQNVEKANDDGAATNRAMNGDKTNKKKDVATYTLDGYAALDTSTGAGGFTDNTEEPPPREADTARHNGAMESD